MWGPGLWCKIYVILYVTVKKSLSNAKVDNFQSQDWTDTQHSLDLLCSDSATETANKLST